LAKKKSFITEVYIERDGRTTVTKISPELLEVLEKLSPGDGRIKKIIQKTAKRGKSGRR
jgi:hypothetical protein